MSGLSAPISFATASSSFVPSLSTSTMANTSSTPSVTESPPVLSASPSVPPLVTTTTSPATPPANNEILVVSSVSSSAATYVSGTESLPPSITSLISDSSLQSMSSSSADTTATATSSNASTHLSASVTQTSTTNEQAQITSSGPVSVTTVANINVSEPRLTPIGTSTGASATYTQIGTASISNSFFNNRGAVIGTFVAVAVFSTAIFACLYVAWRPHLRRRTRDRMLKTIKLLGDGGLQDGPHDQPMISIISDSTVRSDTLLHGITASISTPATGNTTNWTGLHYDGPFSDYFATYRTSRSLTGLAITADLRSDSPVPSSAPSTPSISPPSLPPIDTEHNMTRSIVYSACLSTPSINPLPRPPRRKPPSPPPFRDLIEDAAIPFIPATLVSVDTVVPPSSSPPDSFSPPSSVKDGKHKSSTLSEELQLQIPPPFLSDHSRMYSQPCSITTAALVLDRPTNVQLKRADTPLVDTRAVPREL